MSAQNPPSGPPTTPPGESEESTQPVEGSGPTASEGAAPASSPAGSAGDTTAAGSAPPPPPPGDTTTFDQAPPPPPASRSSKGPVIIGIAVLLVLLLVGGAVAVILNVTGEDTHSISIPSTAGGMKRDTDKENELKQQLDAAEQQFKTQAKNDVSYVRSGVYDQADKDKGPEGALVFLGAKLKGTNNSPTKFVNDFGKQAGSNGFKIENVSAGDGGGKAVCASQSQGQKVAICAWATRDSMGELIPTVPGWDAAKLAAVMRELRKDVEKTE